MRTPMRAARRQVEQIRRRIKAHSEKWRAQMLELTQKEKFSQWRSMRHFDEYMQRFESLISTGSLLSHLRTTTNTNGRPARVMDDGAGVGNAIIGIKQEAQAEGIPIHTTAVTLKNNSRLTTAKKTGKIDEIIKGNAEFLVPKQPYDLILSFMGSTTYTLHELRKLHFLKTAYCLNKGGIMLANFEISIGATGLSKVNLSKKTRPYYSRRLLVEHYAPTVAVVQKAIDVIERDLNGISRAFKKRGFIVWWTFDSPGTNANDALSGRKDVSMMIKRIK